MIEYLPLIIVVALIVLAFRAMRRKLDGLKNPLLVQTSVYKWPELGLFEVDIVGESHYQKNIAASVKERDKDETDAIYQAILIPEDGNQYDDKAVRVDIDSLTVGYLDRDTARSFRRRLGAKKLTGQITSCQAMLKGGHMLHDGSKASYGVMLDLKEFD